MSVLALLVECGDAVTKILFEKEFPKQAMMSRQIKVQDQYSLSCKGHIYTSFLFLFLPVCAISLSTLNITSAPAFRTLIDEIMNLHENII